MLPGVTPRLVWSVIVDGRDGEFRSLVDAQTGAVVRTDDLVRRADGTGRVFESNPVVSRQNESLVDDGDADSAVPTAAYSRVTLHHLDGSGRLSGSYANIALPASAQVTSSSNAFGYSRHDDRFEQVMAYYAVDTAQSYLHRLGFKGVNGESQDLLPDASSQDNSWYSPEADTITFGSGDVDDAEDAKVIWHEYGHAVQDAQVPGFGTRRRTPPRRRSASAVWTPTRRSPTRPARCTTTVRSGRGRWRRPASSRPPSATEG